ncbi:hypothetical protein HYW30_01250 [Candidatus Azambacteria bacterium]|nr:hypothetical protein [Candidatus Azambacteria bacterium]
MHAVKIPKITVTRHRLTLEPYHDVFRVRLEYIGGLEMEIAGSLDLLWMYIRGAIAAWNLAGISNISRPEIPDEVASELFQEGDPNLDPDLWELRDLSPDLPMDIPEIEGS